MSLIVRAELATDTATIRTLTEVAFRGMPYADGDEQDVIDRLRTAGALHLSLVASIEQKIVGQITFSPAGTPNSSQVWFGLGPVSVLPQHQRQGVGSALIERGLETIRSEGASGCILTGNPDYYQRFGFELSPETAPAKEPAEFFMVKTFAPVKPQGRFSFHDAFYGDAEH